jgi:allantoate deiminase
MHEVHREVTRWMQEAGMEVQVDAAGNIRGVYGRGPRLMIGSHLDTVPHAGPFDGILGVMMGIALVEEKPPFAVEVVGFSEEEGVRFRVPFIGSRALVGDPVRDEAVLQAIRDFDLDPAALPKAALAREVKGYLEFHIEQGPVLDQKGLPLGARPEGPASRGGGSDRGTEPRRYSVSRNGGTRGDHSDDRAMRRAGGRRRVDRSGGTNGAR